jgi:folate-dependent phosphoribosylglycinamide formyltransferase PurN
MWRDLFIKNSGVEFFLVIVRKGWDLGASRGLNSVSKRFLSFLLYCIHYGLLNTVIKLFYRMTEYISGFSREERKIRTVCSGFRVPVFSVDSPNEKNFSDIIEDIRPDLMVYQTHVKLDENIITRIPYGVVCRHPSKLPYYRGCFPLFWAFLKRDFKNIGVSLFKLNGEYDKGDIFDIRQIEVTKRDSFRDIYRKSYVISSDMIGCLIRSIRNSDKPVEIKKQSLGSYYGWPALSDMIKYLFRISFVRRIGSYLDKIIYKLSLFIWSVHSSLSEILLFPSRKRFIRNIRFYFQALAQEERGLKLKKKCVGLNKMILVGSGPIPYTALYYRKSFHEIICVEKNKIFAAMARNLLKSQGVKNITITLEDAINYSFPDKAFMLISLLTQEKESIVQKVIRSKDSLMCLRVPSQRSTFRYEQAGVLVNNFCFVDIKRLAMQSALINTNSINKRNGY